MGKSIWAAVVGVASRFELSTSGFLCWLLAEVGPPQWPTAHPRGSWKSHREWMIRSYSLVLGIIGIRFWLGIFRVMGVENEPAFGAAAWIGWVNTLLVAEL